ncbi:adenosine deaminase [Enterococcus saccharolyticus]|uniref:Adenosine deaminase n=1 Tax=Candidatus Enterococcus willemsii TaxID=1857215 RepID=A0ABQ6YX64_9ENTE|nr:MULTISPECIES: adenosine deaminase [Enterococcus]KAF1301955.1 adenosine deaminase [Enterococcus sp. CU12B]MCD5002937.1 adenosine deaminase [Enterococcus saccharolyticus]
MHGLPKIELHCHLDGSLRVATVLDIARKEGIELPTYHLTELKHALIAPEECTSLADYLQCFALPNAVMQSKESLKRITFELFEDAAKENVKYLEVRFGPQLHTMKGLTLEEVIQSVIDGLKLAEARYEIKGNIILSCLRSMSVESAFEVVESGKSFLGKGVVAIDLCAIEEDGFCTRFVEPIALAREYGYHVTIHAGETGSSQNVLDAVDMLGAERIGHGVFIKDDPIVYQRVKEQQIVLEMCPTSNVQTKAVLNYQEHPFYLFHQDGIKVTMNTDNRTVSHTTMTNEWEIMEQLFTVDKQMYQMIYETSVQAAFATQAIKEWCLSQYPPTIH